MALTLWIALGGAFGATLRHFMNVLIARIAGGDFPWHAMLISISGSFVRGFSLDFAVLVERKTYALAGAYALGSVILSLMAIFAGMAFARMLA